MISVAALNFHPRTAADMSEKLDTVKVDTVSLPIALGLWLMMWPVLTKVWVHSSDGAACPAASVQRL